MLQQDFQDVIANVKGKVMCNEQNPPMEQEGTDDCEPGKHHKSLARHAVDKKGWPAFSLFTTKTGHFLLATFCQPGVNPFRKPPDRLGPGTSYRVPSTTVRQYVST